MSIYSCRNVNAAYERLLPAIKMHGIVADSRNGKVLTFPDPQVLLIRKPWERVLFDARRNANPFFHLMEALWMIAGRNDVEFVRQFNKNMYTFSDDGFIFNGAYGYRWRQHFGYDQIARACEMLANNPNDRRVVMTMWDPHIDLGSTSLDIPCNQQAIFRLDTGVLQMVTTNRSNDLIWGLLGANAVHLTVLQEYMAARIGVPMGPWSHMSANLHIYEHHWPLLESMEKGVGWDWRPYPAHVPLVSNWQDFEQDCIDLCNGKVDYFKEPFFDEVVAPMIQSWNHWKEGQHEEALYQASCIGAEDWGTAATDWLSRALEKRNELR